jgi:mRNA interferase RelE/StbE
LKRLRGNDIYHEAKQLCFEVIVKYKEIEQIKNIKKIKGHRLYYRIRTGDYRIGLKIEGDALTFMRILHRKDIYRHFP